MVTKSEFLDCGLLEFLARCSHVSAESCEQGIGTNVFASLQGGLTLNSSLNVHIPVVVPTSKLHSIKHGS